MIVNKRIIDYTRRRSAFTFYRNKTIVIIFAFAELIALDDMLLYSERVIVEKYF